MDVKSSFLNGDLEEGVDIEQLEGFILGNDEKLVCKLKKALYGLKQAPRHGIIVLTNIFINKDFQRVLLIETYTQKLKMINY